MRRLKKKRFVRNVGSAPGTLVHIGEERTEATRIGFMDFDIDTLHENAAASPDQIRALKDRDTTTWINIEGIQDLTLIERIGRWFNIHPLTLEDIVNTEHRPKIEVFDGYLFIILKMLHYDEADQRLTAEQVSMVVGRHWLISFEETTGAIFDPVRERIRRAKGRIRASGCDYLAYALLDTIVDYYVQILDALDARLEQLEYRITDSPEEDVIGYIHRLRRDVIFLRRQSRPLSEIIATLRRQSTPLLGDTIRPFLDDVSDHVIHINDTLETYRDIIVGMLDLYLSLASNRMNEVMKVLTIIATIFIPLTFVAGIYGMNFKYMPELDWRWGYAMVWGVMILVAGGLIVFFRRKKWF